jgi:hypothetical protein
MSDKKEREGPVPEDQQIETDRPPYSYGQVEETPPELPPLNLEAPGSPQTSTVSQDQCIVHLKFLAAIADLRDTIGNTDPLFGLEESQANGVFNQEQDIYCARARIREKRWAIYTARAVDRFIAWWNACVPTTGIAPTLMTLTTPQYSNITKGMQQLQWPRDILPPLGE